MRRLLTIYVDGMVELNVETLNETSLVFYNPSTRETSQFAKIDYSPQPVSDNDISVKIIGRPWSDKNSKYILYFGTDGKVSYLEQSDKPIGSFGYPCLNAKGTYLFSGNTANCNFNDVSWDYSSSYHDLFPGWSAGMTNEKTFQFENTYTNSIRVTLPNGKSVYMDPRY